MSTTTRIPSFEEVPDEPSTKRPKLESEATSGGGSSSNTLLESEPPAVAAPAPPAPLALGAVDVIPVRLSHSSNSDTLYPLTTLTSFLFLRLEEARKSWPPRVRHPH